LPSDTIDSPGNYSDDRRAKPHTRAPGNHDLHDAVKNRSPICGLKSQKQGLHEDDIRRDVASRMDRSRRHVLTAAALAFALPWAVPVRAAVFGKADWVHVIKSIRQLQLFRAGHVLKTYAIALGSHPDGTKLRLGDGRTPEGVYSIDGRLANSAYHRALHVSYPDPADIARARAEGVNPGGAIFIHGLPANFGRVDLTSFPRDWTNGCISVGNIAIEEIWDAVDDGTPVEILA